MLNAGTAPKGLPARVFVFGITSLPPFYLQVLEHVSASIDVHMFVQSPCHAFWGHAQSERSVLKDALAEGMSVEHFKQRFHHEAGNPLLTSMGRHIQDFSALLPLSEDLKMEEEEINHPPVGHSLLARLQQDVFHFIDGAHEPLEERRIREDDASVQIHVCHSPMREVQALRDQLIELLKTQARPATLEPNDVVVMIPDLESYAPYIDAVFSVPADDPLHIPFCVSDRAAANTNPAASFLTALYALPASRFTTRDVVQMLEIPLLRARFGFSEAEYTASVRLIANARIRWGYDADQRESISGIASLESAHTWLFGLERLLLGYALPGDGMHLFEGRLPDRDVEGADAVTVGKLAHFVRSLHEVCVALASSRSVAAWCRFTQEVMKRFLLGSYETRRHIDEVHLLLSAIREESRLAEFDQSVNANIFSACLGQRLEKATEHGRYLTRGVTFCNLLPFRGIPFKVICLLGMNDQDFPRGENPPAFDLMSASPRLGDRSTRDDDRYMFLEAILSARERLMISYTGRDIRDNGLKPPSPVVSELVEYLDRSFALDVPEGDATPSVSQALTRLHPLQPFSPVYFSGENPHLFSYEREYAEGLQQSAGTPSPSERFLEPLQILEPVQSMSLDAFCRFFLQPTRYFMNTRMNVYADNDSVELEEAEPFTLGNLDRYTVTQQILAMREEGHSQEAVYQVAHAQGLLPHGVVGESIAADVAERVDTFLLALDHVLGGREATPLEISFSHKGMTLKGSLQDIYADEQVLSRCGSMRDRDRVDAWIRHLMANTQAPTRTLLMGTNKGGGVKTLELASLAQPKEAEAALAAFVEAFQAGQALPLRFFPSSSLEYVRQLAKGYEEDRALIDAGKVWWGSNHSPVPGEAADPYHHMVFGQDSPFDENFCQLALTLLQPLAERLVTKTQNSSLKPLST